jgi:hypothetical protein
MPYKHENILYKLTTEPRLMGPLDAKKFFTLHYFLQQDKRKRKREGHWGLKLLIW